MFVFLVLFPLIMSFAGWFVGRSNEKAAYKLALLTTSIEFLLAVIFACMPNNYMEVGVIAGLGLRLEMDGFRKVYTLILSFMWMMSTALSGEYFNGHHKLNRYFFFLLLTLSSIMGVFLSGNLYTAFVFFEIMSFASYPWVVQEETKDAIRAADTYLAIAVIGGLTALMGIFIFQYKLGTTNIGELFVKAAACTDKSMMYAAGACVLVGFGAKAGMFPLHIWLPKAHPIAPAPASALLSGALTKSGIFGILVLSCNVFLFDDQWGMLILILGTITMFGGALLALFSINLKRTLACSSMSQIGFILVGIGMIGLLGEEASIAGYGTILHMVNHSLFKLVLFLCAGVVYMNCHKLELNDIKGFGKGKTLLHICFLLGALGIGGIPGLNGYISKTLIHESIVEGSHMYGSILKVIEWIFLISGGLTLAYMTKLYICIFHDQPETADRHENKPYMNRLSLAALCGSTITLPVLGLLAPILMNKIAEIGTDFFNTGVMEHAVHYYSLENLKGAVISVIIGAVIYLFVVRKLLMKDGRYVDRLGNRFDLEDHIYRPVLAILARICGIIAHIASDVVDAAVLLLRVTLFRDAKLPTVTHAEQSFSYKVGSLIDAWLVRLHKEKPRQHKYGKLFYRVRVTWVKTTHELSDSMSFALLMLCIAISAILLYVLFLRQRGF